ncbi:MAG TPA: hypothetical protein VK817_10915 [Trebonia sp.]|jgi:hypothetical protein|nr:hypothetical protein [Trebonia sp.]
MIIRAALCPSPPLLARELTGRDVALPDLRDACATAVALLLAAGPDTVTVVGGAPATATWGAGDRLDLAAFAPVLRGRVPGGTPGLPAPVGLGAMLLDEAGYDGPLVLQAVGQSAPADECVRLGASLAAAGERTGLLVMGDGTAKRTPKAPGHFDERAEPFDASVEKAVRSGDMPALAALDAGLARDLMATGRAAWQVLAGALGAAMSPSASSSPGEVLYSGAPYGVSYLVAVLEPMAAPVV